MSSLRAWILSATTPTTQLTRAHVIIEELAGERDTALAQLQVARDMLLHIKQVSEIEIEGLRLALKASEKKRRQLKRMPREGDKRENSSNGSCSRSATNAIDSATAAAADADADADADPFPPPSAPTLSASMIEEAALGEGEDEEEDEQQQQQQQQEKQEEEEEEEEDDSACWLSREAGTTDDEDNPSPADANI
eukprot:evm.model.NODE_35244_length_30808_cov_23.771132.6